MAAPTTAQQLAAVKFVLTNCLNPQVLAAITSGLTFTTLATFLQKALKTTATVVGVLTKALTVEAATLSAQIATLDSKVTSLTAAKAAITPH